VEASNGNIAGMDVVGDWSPVHLKGIGRRLLHWTEHPVLDVWPLRASRQNQRTNLTLADLWNEWRAACGLAIAA
jgi:hypothetical protein